MILDVVTVMVVTGAVATTVGIIFITEMLRRHSGGAGRIWSLSFLAGMLSIVSYAAWGTAPGSWVPLAVGNAAFVAIPGIVWVGARRYNGRPNLIAGIIAAALCAATALAVVLAPDPTDTWAGAPAMFLAAALAGVLAATEARRAPLRMSPGSVALAAMMIVGAGYYIARLITLLTLGPDVPAFIVPFGVTTASLVSCLLTVVTASVLTTILADQRTLMALRRSDALVLSTEGIFDAAAFAVLLHDVQGRAAARAESIAVVCVQIDDLDRISTAFGAAEAERLRSTWRVAARASAPTEAVIGDDSDGSLLVLLAPASTARVRAAAVQVRRGVNDALIAAGGGAVPAVRVGSAVCTDVTVDVVAAAREDAARDRTM